MSGYSSPQSQLQHGNIKRKPHNNYYKNSNTRASKYVQGCKQKLQIQKVDMIRNTQYLCHTNSDVIYLPTVSRITNNQTNVYLYKQLLDLNLLLYLQPSDFWRQLSSDTLIKALQGALASFSNRQYGFYVDKQNKNQQIDCKRKIAGIQMRQYQLLIKTILKIYHRIIFEAQGDQERTNQIYENWLLDIPKILDLIAIYKYSNPQIVRKMVSKIFSMNPNYSNDFSSFLSTIVTSVIPLVFKDLFFEINMFKLNTSNFGNARRSFLRNMMKCTFLVNDYFMILRNVIDFFPSQQVSNLVADYQILQNSIRIHVNFTNNFRKKWVLQQSFAKILKPVFQKIWQFQVEYFGKFLRLLTKSVQKGQAQYFNDKLQSYFTFLRFISKGKRPAQKNSDGQDFQAFIKTIKAIIKQQKSEALFFSREQLEKILKQVKKGNLSQKQLVLLDQSHAFQQKIIRISNQNGQQSTLVQQNLVMQRIMPYQVWVKQQFKIQNDGNQKDAKIHNQTKKLFRYFKQYDDQPDPQQQQTIFKTVSLPNQWNPACLADRPRYQPKKYQINTSLQQAEKQIQNAYQSQSQQNFSFSVQEQNQFLKFDFKQIEQQEKKQLRNSINSYQKVAFEQEISHIENKFDFESDTLYECSFDQINILKNLNFEDVSYISDSFIEILQKMSQDNNQISNFFNKADMDDNQNLSLSMISQTKHNQTEKQSIFLKKQKISFQSSECTYPEGQYPNKKTATTNNKKNNSQDSLQNLNNYHRNVKYYRNTKKQRNEKVSKYQQIDRQKFNQNKTQSNYRVQTNFKKYKYVAKQSNEKNKNINEENKNKKRYVQAVKQHKNDKNNQQFKSSNYNVDQVEQNDLSLI